MVLRDIDSPVTSMSALTERIGTRKTQYRQSRDVDERVDPHGLEQVRRNIDSPVTSMSALTRTDRNE